MTSPGAHGEGEAVAVYREDGFHEDGSPGWWSAFDAGDFIPACWREGRWMPLAAYNALLARANTAKVAADLMRARAERAEAAVEAAYRDGYGDGYKDGANDEQGSDVDGAWKHSDTKAALGRERA